MMGVAENVKLGDLIGDGRSRWGLREPKNGTVPQSKAQRGQGKGPDSAGHVVGSGHGQSGVPG